MFPRNLIGDGYPVSVGGYQKSRSLAVVRQPNLSILAEVHRQGSATKCEQNPSLLEEFFGVDGGHQGGQFQSPTSFLSPPVAIPQNSEASRDANPSISEEGISPLDPNPEASPSTLRPDCTTTNTPNTKHGVLDYSKFKTALCRNWLYSGRCIFSDSCGYAHGCSEMRLAPNDATLPVNPEGAVVDSPSVPRQAVPGNGQALSHVTRQVLRKPNVNILNGASPGPPDLKVPPQPSPPPLQAPILPNGVDASGIPTEFSAALEAVHQLSVRLTTLELETWAVQDSLQKLMTFLQEFPTKQPYESH